jgi:hypothetical protein
MEKPKRDTYLRAKPEPNLYGMAQVTKLENTLSKLNQVVILECEHLSRYALILIDPGWLTESDRKKQNTDRTSQNQDVSNTFHNLRVPIRPAPNSLQTKKRIS